MNVVRYEPGMQVRWDEFVRASKNGTFLFERAYMDYHADRFEDHSLVVIAERGEWLAALPASRAGAVVTSHGGLTYGGFVVGDRMGTPLMLDVLERVRDHLAAAGVSLLRYKTIPHIYHRRPAEEDRYALFRAGARLWRRDVLAVVTPDDRHAFQERRERRVKRARREGVTVEESADMGAFWGILEGNLMNSHATRPVHRLDEIELLHGRFPGRVRLHLARHAGAAVAGVIVYDTGPVAHVQYIGSSEQGRELGALDLAFAELLQSVYLGSRYFDFGISNEEDGQVLNIGLIEQKEGFGARAVAHDFYEVQIQ